MLLQISFYFHYQPYRPLFAVFQYFSTFFQKRKILTAHRVPIYQIKAHKMLIHSFRFDEYVCLGRTLNLDISSKFLENFKGIWEILGEIPHVRCEIRGV